jgi:paraquat-inducible protein A
MYHRGLFQPVHREALGLQSGLFSASVSGPADIACIECDLLLPDVALADGERARCPRCNHLLKASPRDGLTRSLAFTVSSAVLLLAACSFPFLSLHAKGLESAITLLQAARELWLGGREVLAVLVFAFIVAVPGVMVVALLALLTPLVRGRNAPWLVPTGRLVFTLEPWSMAEVFVIGAIVSLVKIAAMAGVVLGLSFWAYIAFCVCFTAALSSLDRAYVWDAIERVSRA